MSELQNKLNLILNEKTNKILPENIKSGINIFGVSGNVRSVSNNMYTMMKYLPVEVEDGYPYTNDSDTGYDFIYPTYMWEQGEYISLPNVFYFSVLDKTNNNFKVYWTDSIGSTYVDYDEANSQLNLHIDSSLPESVFCSTLQVDNMDALPSFSYSVNGYNSVWLEDLNKYSWNTVNMQGKETSITYNLLDTNLEFYASNIYNATDVMQEAKTGSILEGTTAYDKFGNILNGSMLKRTNVAVLNSKIVPSNNVINISPRFAGYYSTNSVLQINNLGLADKIGLTASNLPVGVSVLNLDGTYTSDANATVNDILNGKTAYVNGVKVTGNYTGGGYILQDGMRFGGSNRVFNNGVGWDTSNVTTMASLFSGCALLPYVDVSNWDTSNVVYMDKVFVSCQALNNLDISNWNTSNVKSMSNTFYGCSRVTKLDVSNWDTGNLLETVGMFYSCSNLDTIDVSNWNTSKIGTTSNMFDFCVKLNNITVNTWNVANIQNMNRMFNSCRSLTEINLSEWNTHKVTDMSYMFHNCVNLVNISFTNWNTINMLKMENMFLNCNNLSSETYSNIINMLPDANQLTNKYVTNLGINESKLNLRQKDDLTIKGYTVESITPPGPILD